MKFYHPLLWSLGLFLLGTTSACRMIPPVVSQDSSHEAIIEDLKTTDIVYLGEVHDRAADHEAQLKIIQALHENNPNIAIGLEMFQRPFQGVINDYLAGNITEAQLRKQTEYDQRWGFPWSYYAPLLQFAKTNNLPVLALNTPTELTRQVAREGLESLTEEDFRYIPPLSDIDTDDPEYRQFLKEIYSQHHGHGNSGNFDNFVAAQVLWDETMAEKIVQFSQDNPNHQIIVIAGRGHIIYDYGIPSRVARRLNTMQFTQRSLIFLQSPTPQMDDSLADYVWHHSSN